jgi:hypothetical protein
MLVCNMQAELEEAAIFDSDDDDDGEHQKIKDKGQRTWRTGE